MPIQTSDIKFYLSGGSSNTNPNLSLGGVISTTEIGTAINSLFDDVTGDESASGDIEYRAFYVKNTHVSLTWIGVKFWVETQTPAGDDISIGKEASLGSPKQTIATENDAPTGIVFSAPSTKVTGISIGDLAPGDGYMLWIKRNVPVSTTAYNNNSFTIKLEGDSRA